MSGLPAPRVDEDSYDIIDDAVAALAKRRGLWIGDEAMLINLLASLIDQAMQWLPHAVDTARENRRQPARHRRAHRRQRRTSPAAFRRGLTHRRREVALAHIMKKPLTTKGKSDDHDPTPPRAACGGRGATGTGEAR